MPAPETAMSRMAESRRDISVMRAMIATTPSEVIHQIEVINHRTPLGGEPSVVAMVCLRSEFVLVPSQHTTRASAARPSLTASEPRRRVCPSPTGAKTMARHRRPFIRHEDSDCWADGDAGAGSVVAVCVAELRAGSVIGPEAGASTLSARPAPSWCPCSIPVRTLRPGLPRLGHRPTSAAIWILGQGPIRTT